MTFSNFDPSDINPDTSIRSGSVEHEQETDEQEFIESRTAEPLEDGEARRIQETFGGNAVSDLAFQQSPRNPVQQIPGAWIHPMKRQARINAVKLPRWNPNFVAQKIASIMRFTGAPAPVEEAAQAARDAVQKVRDVLAEARHPDQPAFAVSPEAKKAVEAEVARANLAVSHLEQVAEQHSDEWFESLTDGLEAKRKAAEKAVKAAYESYSEFANARAGAHALAEHQGRFAGDWHSHPEARELDPTAAIGALAKVRRIVSSADDDWLSGRYLTAEYDGVPPHTVARLQAGAEKTQPGSYARQVASRAKANRSDDPDLQRAIAMQDLRILTMAPSLGFQPRDED